MQRRARQRQPPAATSGREPVQVVVETRYAEAGVSRDMHYALELGLVLSGRLRCHYTSWQTDLSPGGVWLCGTWERHGREALSPRCRLLRVLISPRMLLQIRPVEAPDIDFFAPFRVAPDRRPVAHGRVKRELKEIADRFQELIEGSGACQHTLRRAMALELLITLLSGWKGAARRNPALDERCCEVVGRAVELALQHPGITSAEAARACGLSIGAFGRAFERMVGLSFAKFCLRHRLSEAAAQLLSTGAAASQIGRRCGFANPSHFYRSFRQHYHLSPAEYRERPNQAKR